MTSLPRWLTGAALLALWFGPVRADDLSKIGVDVVMDFTPAGKKFVPPTADHPVFYLPLPVGYKQKGGVVTDFQRTAPPPEQIEHLIAKMLAQQHYFLMTKTAHPTLVLTISWGYKAPQTVNTGAAYSPNEGQSVMARGGNPGMALAQSNLHFNTNDAEMEDLVAGHLVDAVNAEGGINSRNIELNHMAQEPRWYVEITAGDFQDWLHHKWTPLWREAASVELWGHYLDEVLPGLINAAGPLIGRPMNAPAIVSTPLVVPPGWVTVGKPVVVPPK